MKRRENMQKLLQRKDRGKRKKGENRNIVALEEHRDRKKRWIKCLNLKLQKKNQWLKT